MTTTSQLRIWWAPACTGPFQKVALHGDGIVTVRATIVDAVHALNRCLEHHDYHTRRADTGAYNCRQITGGTGYSLHAYGIALDLNWGTNPYGPVLKTDMPAAMIASIKAIRTRTGRQVWRWGGDYAGNKDAMHFEVVCSPADLAAGIDGTTVPGGAPREDDDDMAQTIVWYRSKDGGEHAYRVWGIFGVHIPTLADVDALKAFGVAEFAPKATAGTPSMVVLFDGPCQTVGGGGVSAAEVLNQMSARLAG